MADYKIELGVGLRQSDLDSIKTKLENLVTDGIKIKIDSGSIRSDMSSVTRQIQSAGSDAGQSFARGFGSGASIIRTEANNATNTIQHMRQVLARAKFNNASIDAVTRNLEEMNLEIQRVSTRINNDNLNISIRGIDELGRAVTIVKQFDHQSGNIVNVSKTIAQSFDTSADAAKRFQKEVDAAFSEMNQKAKQIGSLQFKLAGLDASKDISQIKEIERQINSLESEYKELDAVFGSYFSPTQIDKLSQSFQSVSDKVGLLNAEMADTSAVKEQEQEYKKLLSLAQEIGQLNIKIADLDADKNSNEIRELTAQLNILQNEYDELFVMTNRNLSGGQVDALSQKFADVSNKIGQLNAKIADTRAKLAEDIKLKIDTDISKEISKVHSDFDKLSTKTVELQQKLKMLDDIKIDLDTAKANNDIEGLISANEKYERVLKDVKAQIDISARAEKDAFGKEGFELDKEKALIKLKSLFSDNTEAARIFGARVQELEKNLRDCGDAKGLKNINKQISNLSLEIKKANVQTQTFGEKLKNQFSKYKDYLSIASIFMWVEQGLEDMFRQVVAIDSAMTELKKVTDETDASYDKFLRSASTRAKEIGTTLDGLIQSTASFARLGYGFEDSQGLAEVANIYAVVGDEINGVEDATQSLVSTLAAFKSEMNGMSDTDFAMSIVDKMNEVSNNFAISSGGIGEALKRSASSMSAANNSLDETIALITAAM